MVQVNQYRYLLIIIALFFSYVNSFPQQQSNNNNNINNNNNNISFGAVLRNNLISNNAHTESITGSNNGGPSSRNINDNNSNINNMKDTMHRGWQYWCDPCSCGFNKLKSYNQHISGKRHNEVIAESEILWANYIQSGPAFYDPSVTQEDVTRAWSLDLFMEGLQARSRSSIKHVLVAGVSGGQLDPSLRLGDLTPPKRAALWRFLHTSGVPGLASMVAALPPRYVRVKEILESVETYSHVERLMKRSTVKGQKATKVSHIYDVGCGHGLVGMLCAASFPHITVHAIDLVPRDSFQAQRQAFEAAGTILDNLTFEAGDLSILHDRDEGGGHDDHSLLLCVHGCKSLTHESIELAERNNWAWLSLPCCLQSENHLDENTSLKVSDDTRFAMLCGAIAAKYQPETITTIDSRITARGIVLTSSGRNI